MRKKILITYESKTGSTAETAEFIGKELYQAGAQVDVRHIKNVKTLYGYDAVVIGSAIRAGQWLAGGFVKKYQMQLKKVPVAYFMLCMTLEKDTPQTRSEVAAYLQPTRALVPPISEGHFAGKMDYSKLGWLLRTIVKSIGTPEGDYRKWDVIKPWTHELYVQLAKQMN